MYESNLKIILEEFERRTDYPKQEILERFRALGLAREGLLGKIKGEWNLRRLHKDGMYFGKFYSTKGRPGYYHLKSWNDDF